MFNINTSELVAAGHPDKACDRFSDAVLDGLLDAAAKVGANPRSMRSAVECAAKGNLVLVTGEVGGPEEALARLDVEALIHQAWSDLGYDHAGPPTVINYVKPQAREIASLVDGDGQAQGAGDQGIMVGHAVADTPELMPREYVAARNLLMRMEVLRKSGQLPWLRSDAKSQVSMSKSGEVMSAVISTQHSDDVSLDDLRATLAEQVVLPVLGDVPADRIKINAKGSFVEGGTVADAGLTGRKIVVDAYGPAYAVGGGAFSGKDPSKVDRSAAYMARLIAKTALATEFQDAERVVVQLAYGIGQVQPEAISGRLDNGKDIRPWIEQAFPDLSPGAIQEHLGLWDRKGWRYVDTASNGHFGREDFPWERIDNA